QENSSGVEKEETMMRRDLLKRSAALGCVAAFPFSSRGWIATGVNDDAATSAASPLRPPAEGSIPVAFLISDGAVIIDFCGPWEVFQDVSLPNRGMQHMHDAFKLFTVAEATKPIRASAGMKILPDYTFEDAPPPKVIVIPAQGHVSDAGFEWLRKSSKTADVTMSVCTGAFVLAEAGLLAGKTATTHHSAYKGLAMEFPSVQVKRGARFVESGNIATAGGLSSGIDLALRVVERYYGRDVATATAYQMEYQGEGWKNPNSNQAYAAVRVSTDEHPLCPVCDMDVEKETSPTTVYKGKTYYFCMDDHKELFLKSPEKYLRAV
ncbi:MAG TPA: DJ-1/PfpI family protein, partial [Terriglobales bacterium]|nr:DJ-1/PfpI family protein [Terriglobales bacterium]